MVEHTIKVKDIMTMRINFQVIQPILEILMVKHTMEIRIISRVMLYLLSMVMVKDIMVIRIMVIVIVVLNTNSFSLLSLLMGTMAIKDKREFNNKMVE
jgi:hypothetical protein